MKRAQPNDRNVETGQGALVNLVHVQSFRAGQPVPEWLVFLEPQSPSAHRGMFCFAVDADLYEKDDKYWLLPTDPLVMQAMFALIGTQDCSLNAGGLQVSWPAQIVTGRPLGHDK